MTELQKTKFFRMSYDLSIAQTEIARLEVLTRLDHEKLESLEQRLLSLESAYKNQRELIRFLRKDAILHCNSQIGDTHE